MDFDFGVVQGARGDKQRKLLLIGLGTSLAINAVLVAMALTKSQEIVLTPVIQSPVSISSSRISHDYLELMTRDVALMILNRTPQSLEYWMNNVLKITDPSAYGDVKSKLVVMRQKFANSDFTQSFDIEKIYINPDDMLTSEVTGILHVYVGSKEVAQEPVRYRLNWTYQGLSLKLAGFSKLDDKNRPERPEGYNPYRERGGE